MPHPLEAGTLRILRPNGSTAGTGFLASKRLAVTCAHVVTAAMSKPGDVIKFKFHLGDLETQEAIVLEKGWSKENDVAILELTEELPKWVHPIIMQSSHAMEGNEFQGLGYPDDGLIQARWIQGAIGGRVDVAGYAISVLQIQGEDVDKGVSGSAIMDKASRKVVAIFSAYQDLVRPASAPHKRIAYAIPTETIWQVCPQLKPIPSPLPRRNPLVEGINLLPYDYDQRIQNFLTEYLGGKTHPVPFGGRDQALHTLDSWLAKTTPYLLLAAPAGRGKSALLVRWLEGLSAREDLALAFVPVSIRFGTNMERVFYAALAARLASLHGDDVPASPETSTAIYRGLVSDYLSKPLANSRTLLVVLDGLDEAADWQAGADFMPGQLPAGVRVVVSARYLAGDADSVPWLRRLNWEHSGLASAPSLVPLDQAGVADVLLKMSCPLDELSRNVNIVAELYRLSEGDPLLVSLYVSDLWAKGEAVARLKPEDLADMQPGYKGYFERWWDNQKKLWGKEKPWMEGHVRTVRNLLAGALEPLFRDNFQALNPKLESDYIADALDVLQRFIIGDNRVQGYTFSHPKLGLYFWEALTPTEQAQVEGCFLSWGEQTLKEFIAGKRDPKKKAEVLAYVVRTYSAHLERAKQPIEKWLPLIHHQQWAQAWFTEEGSYGGYLQDVQRIWNYCKLLDRDSLASENKALYIAKQIRCAFIDSSLHNLVSNIPTQLIPLLIRDGIWTLSQAWIFILQMTTDLKQQVEAIVEFIPKATDYQLLDILKLARTIRENVHRARVLSALVIRLPDCADDALEAAMAIENRWQRRHVLIDLARHLPEEQLTPLLVYTQEIDDEIDQALILSVLIPRLPNEKLEQIQKKVRLFQDQSSKARVMGALAQRLPKTADEALATARLISDDRIRTNVLIDLAQSIPEAKLVQLVDDAWKIENEWLRATLLKTLAEHIPEGQLNQVRLVLLTIGDKWSRAIVLSTLVLRLPYLAREVLAVVQEIKYDRSLAEVLSVLALNLPQSYLSRILDIAQNLDDQKLRSNILGILAHRLPALQLKLVLTKDLLIVEKKEDASMLINWAQYNPDLTKEVLEVAWTIDDKNEFANLLCSLVQSAPEEQLEQMLEFARQMKETESRAKALIALAHRIPEVTREAWEVARAILDDTERARVLSTLLQQKPEVASEVADETLKLVWAIPNKLKRIELLIPLAKYTKGVYAELLKVAQDLDYWQNPFEVINGLVHRIKEDELKQVVRAWREMLKTKMREEKIVAVKKWARRRPFWISNIWRESLKWFAPISHDIDIDTRSEKNWTEVARELQAIERVVRRTDIDAMIWSALAQRVPEVTEEALKAGRGMLDKSDRAQVLSALVQQIPEVAGEALEAARMIEDADKRAKVLSTLMQCRSEVIKEALEAARGMWDKSDRAQVLSVLAQQLPEVAGEALAATQGMYRDERARALRALSKSILQVNPENFYEQVITFIKMRSNNLRSELSIDLAALMPVILYLGTEDTPGEIYEAVHDVTTWWP